MSESTSHRREKSLKDRALEAGAGILVAAVAYGGGVSTHDKIFPPKKLKMEDVRREAIKQAQAELLAHESAVRQAADYSKAINEGIVKHNTRPIPMQVLNGEIQVTSSPVSVTNDGKGGQLSYKNPIILSTVNPRSKLDKNGDFLIGGWIGVQGNDAKGMITITAVPYNPETNRFVPYDPNEITLATIGVYPIGVSDKGSLNNDYYELMAMDVTGERSVHNPDGTAVKPGFAVGTK